MLQLQTYKHNNSRNKHNLSMSGTILPPFPFPNRWEEIRQQQEREQSQHRRWSVPSAAFLASIPPVPICLLNYHRYLRYKECSQYVEDREYANVRCQLSDELLAEAQEAEDFVPITFTKDEMKKAFAEEVIYEEVNVEDEEYNVDFRLEMNEEWAKRLLPTAQRLKLIAVPKKPSKAKKAHKKKMRAKCKSKKKSIADTTMDSSAAIGDNPVERTSPGEQQSSSEEDSGSEDEDLA